MMSAATGPPMPLIKSSRILRACADRDAMALYGKWTRDARSSGELPSFPTKEDARARAPTLPHRAHLATVLGTDPGEGGEPPARVPPPPHPQQGGLREAGRGLGVRLRLPEDRRRVVLGHHTAGPARRVDRAGGDGRFA